MDTVPSPDDKRKGMSSSVALSLVIILLIIGVAGGFYAGLSQSSTITHTTTSIQTTTQTNAPSTTTVTTQLSPSTTTSTITTTVTVTTNSSGFILVGASLSASTAQLTVTFAIVGRPSFGVSSMSLTGPTLQSGCTLTGNGITLQLGQYAEQLTGNFSGCQSNGGVVIMAGDGYTYNITLMQLPSSTGQVFTGLVVAQ